LLHGNILALDLAEGSVALGSLGLLTLESLTLLRLRGEVFLELDAAAVNERVILAMGIVSVSENAFGVGGVTSVPSPVTDVSEDWIWYGIGSVSSGEEAAINQNSLYQRIMVDSKAMRKLKPGGYIGLRGRDRERDRSGR